MFAASIILRASAPPVPVSARSEYLVEVWDTDRGLPNYGVTSIVQTPDGYLWVGTYTALARFDGVTFKVVNHRNTPEFPGDAITKVYVDKLGHLWVATDKGIACLQDSHWHTYTGPGGRAIVNAADFVEARDGAFRVKAGTRLLVLAGDHFAEQPIPPGIPYLRAMQDSQHDIWLTGEHYLGVFRNGQWTEIPLPADFADALHGAGAGREGVWVASGTKIHKFQDGVWQPPMDSPGGLHFNRVVKFLEDSEGNLWAGDFVNGLFQYRKDGRVLQFTRAEGMPNLAIRWLFEDREKNIWVGTDGGGLVRLRPRRVNVFDEAQGLKEIILDTVLPTTAGSLLIGTYGGGLVSFDPHTLQFGAAMRTGPGPSALILTVFEDGDGSIWAGTFGQGLFHIRGQNAEHISGPELGGSSVRALFRDSRGVLWIGTDQGLASFQGDKFEIRATSPGGIDAIAEDRRGEIWVAGPGGLFHQPDRGFEKYLPKGIAEYAAIDSLYASVDGSLWIGASGRGLDRLRDGVFTSFTTAHGLPDTRIGSMMDGNAGRLWLATDTQGLLAVPVTSFDAVAAGRQAKLDLLWLKKEDGLATNQFRTGFQPAAAKSKDGRLWFATLKGLVLVDTAKAHRNPVIAPVRIEAVGMGGQTVPVDQNSPATLVVPAGSRRVKFYYTALSFTAPERVRFQYRLEPLDAGWTDSAERNVSYGDLRPGNYQFHVRATNNDGVWNPEPASLKLHVEAFLWETWWFRLLASGLVAILVAGAAYGSQRKKLRRRTEQLRQEQSLRRDVERLQDVLKLSEERFSKAFNSSPAAMAISTREEGRFLDANQSFLNVTGFRRDEVIGHLRSELDFWEDPAEFARFIETLEREGTVRGQEVRLRDHKGQLRFQRISCEIIELDGVSCFLTVSDDITERTRLQEQLSQAQKLESVGRLAGGVAHDFNNMLTVINGYSDMLLKRLKQDDPVRQRVNEIRRAGGRAADLTRQLLAFSRRQVIQPKPLNLNDPVRETEQILRRLLPENIELMTRLDPALGLVMADPGQVHQVLMNLAINARDAMPEGGKLIMETANVHFDEQYAASHPDAKQGPCVMVGVSDSGMGMEESVASHIFEPFFTTKPTGAGTGLGLASVYGTVRQSGGWIWVYSEVGRGTTFKIYLPRLASSLPAEDGTPVAARPVHGTETILLVEDQIEVRDLVREVLQSCGYHVIEASHGAEALEIAARHTAPIHLLLTDVMMPGMTGNRLADRLKDSHPESKVLYMSGYTEDVIVLGGMLKPGIAYIPKPLAPDTLAAKVREILG